MTITLRRDDIIRFATRSQLAMTARLGITLTLPTGEATTLTMDNVANTDRSPNTTVKTQFPEGAILETANAFILSGGSASPGTNYAEAYLDRDGTTICQLLGGYLQSGNQPGFPNTPPLPVDDFRRVAGHIYTVTGANPAAGLEANDAVPTNATWRIISYSIVLVTSAAAANRLVQVVTDDGTATNRLFAMGTSTAQTASLTRTHLFTKGAEPSFGADTASIVDTQTVLIRAPIPDNLILPPGDRLRTITAAIDAADDYAAPLIEVEEWLT